MSGFTHGRGRRTHPDVFDLLEDVRARMIDCIGSTHLVVETDYWSRFGRQSEYRVDQLMVLNLLWSHMSNNHADMLQYLII